MKQANEESSVISFRLEGEDLRALEERASALGVSRHALARYLTLDALAWPTHLLELGAAVQELYAEVQGQRQDLSLSVQALLSSAGKTSAKDAKAWAEQCLNLPPKSCSPSQLQ